ncbi:HK97 family phage prohead protease [Pantoea agglomerans]|uniref:HK97 family phage prohead protease n=1 Tax=Enterobacter agglomerans TaxID=549 RepID=UPI001F4EFB01|nr:HK97 family phage prohead protease [Pantoea agglomerans]MCH9404933.1 phage major capsid protein [Pantoea agglomerans]
MEVKKINKREMRIQELPTNDSREVLLAFSSETPVMRCINARDYNEILLHTPEAVNLSRLKNGAALLFNHDFNQHIGIVEEANIDPDKVGRALVRFSSVGLGDEKFAQVKEGVLRKVSVGYEIDDFYIEADNLIVTKWTPYEISMVSVPADDLVGVGRAMSVPATVVEDEDGNLIGEVTKPEMDSEETEDPEMESEDEPVQESQVPEMESEQIETKTETETETEVEVEVEEESEVVNTDDSEMINKQEEQRIAELNSMARVLKLDVSEAIAKGISVDDFKRQIKQPIKEEHNIMENNFSLQNSLRAMSNLDAEFEGANMGARGLKVPASAIRAVNTTTGANLIQETIAYDSYIDILRANSVLAKFPLTVISGLEGDGKLSLPALNSDFTNAFGFIAEDGTSPEATPAFGKVTLEPTDFTGSVYLTRIMMKSAAAAERYTTDAMIKGAATQLEKHVLANVVTEAVAAGNTDSVATIDFDAVVDAVAALGTKNVVSSSIVAVMSPATRASLRKQVVKGNTAAKFLVEGMGDEQVLAGEVPVIESTLVADGQVILGDFSQIVIAQWGSEVELDRDLTTSRNRGGLYLRVWATMDTKVARADSFYVLTKSA